MEDLEHPDVTQALETGYPDGCLGATPDSPEERRAFAEAYAREFFEWLLSSGTDAVDGFVEENWWMYEDWLR